MAILSTLPGVEVTIQVNNQPLVEYEDDSPNETLGQDAERLGPKTVSKYIESVTDQEFTVNWCVARPYKQTSPSLTCEVHVDGRSIAGMVITTPQNISFIPQKTLMKGSASYDPVKKQATIHHFKFSNIIITSDDEKVSDIKKDAKRMSKVGMIEVKIFRTSQPKSVPRGAETPKIGSNNSEVHEKALKGQAKSHGVSSGGTSTDTCSTSASVEWLDGRQSPIANFIFQYRSKVALKQLCIIERTPEPEPLVASRAQDDRRASLPKIKRERDENINVKQEPKAKRSKYKMTIDLTADSSSSDDSIITLE